VTESPRTAPVPDGSGRDPVTQVLEIAGAYRLSQAVYTAAALGLADLLEHPMSGAQLADACAADPVVMGRLLRLLAAHGLLLRRPDGRYAVTELGACLRTGAAGSARAWVLMLGTEQYQAWGALLHAVTTGRPAFDAVHGLSFWDHLARDQAQAELFASAMADSAGDLGPLLLQHVDLAGAETIVDVGGGTGSVLVALLQACPQLRGALLDRPATLECAPAELAAAGLGDRCEVIPGDFFRHVPANADVYLLCRVLGDWDDEQAVTILQVCRRAMRTDSRLIILGGMASDEIPQRQAVLDLHLSVLLGGGDRTAEQFAALLGSAGLTVTRCEALGVSGQGLIEARAAGESSAEPT
jgi:predicted O-methyltransferase YrrM